MVNYSFLCCFFDFYVTRAFSISTINTIGLCVLSWPSCLTRCSVDLEVRASQVRAHQIYFSFIFDDSRRIKLILFVWIPEATNKIKIIFIRRDSRRIKFFLFVGDDSRRIKFFIFVGDDSRRIKLFLFVGIPDE